MSHLTYATEGAIRTLRRRAAGEHILTNVEIVHMHASEWGLKSLEVTQLRRDLQVEDERLRLLSK